jgi:predicted NBD/HSP70 family sugar kinase
MTEQNLRALLGPKTSDTAAGRIVRALSERGPLTAADIARMTGLARSTVSTALVDLRLSGLVRDADVGDDAESKAVGRPGTVITLNPEAGTCVGVHLALDEIRAVIADVSHSFIAEQNIALPKDYSPTVAANILKGWIETTYAENGLRLSGLLGIGVSVSAPVSPDGTVNRSSIVPTWAGVNVSEVFGKAFNTLVLVDNESNCSAIAEWMWGGAVGEPDFVLFKVDLGVGGAVVSNGKLMRGVAGGSGEFGHISLDPDGELCRCGNRGCLELMANLQRPLRILSAAHGREFTVEDAVDLANSGDAGAMRLIADLADVAGRGLAIVCSILNPPLVLVSGALARTGNVFLEPLLSSYERHAHLKTRDLPPERKTRFVFGTLLKNDVVLGAVGMVLRHHGRAG